MNLNLLFLLSNFAEGLFTYCQHEYENQQNILNELNIQSNIRTICENYNFH